MQDRNRIVNLIAQGQKRGQPWLSGREIASRLNINALEMHDVLDDLEQECLVEKSVSSGYLASRYRLASTPGLIGGVRPAVAQAQEDAPVDEESLLLGDSASPLSSASWARLASDLSLSKPERLHQTALSMAAGPLRALPCRAVTSDNDEIVLFTRRRTEFHGKISTATGVDITPVGPVTIVAMGSSTRQQNNDLLRLDPSRTSYAAVGSELMHAARQHQAPERIEPADHPRFARAQVSQRDEAGRITSVTLPRGGNAVPSEVIEVEAMGEAVMLLLGRRVNAKSIVFTVEGAEALIEQLEALEDQGLLSEPDGDTGPSRLVCTENNGQMMSLPKGGFAVVNAIESVQYAGPVLMVNLQRRVNARSITLTRQDAASFLESLADVASTMA